MHKNAVAVAEAGQALGLTIEVKEFPEGTRTAADAAAAIGVGVGQIVKSLVFRVGDPEGAEGEAGGRTVVAYVSGTNQLDEAALASAAGAKAAWRVDAKAVRTATGFPVGGVPPFGHATAMDVYIDVDLLAYDEVWAAAGTPHHVFAITPASLIKASGAIPVPLAKR